MNSVKLKNTSLLKDIISLTHKAMETGDFDPMYPMLEYLCVGMDMEESIWYAMCYVGHYSIASGAWCFYDHPKQVLELKWSYPLRFQRRNLYPSDEYERHWYSLWTMKQKYGSLAKWLERGMTGEGDKDFYWVNKCVQEVRGNSRWAGMKLAEVLKYTTWPHINPCDMCHKYSASPRKGLGLFYDDPGGSSDAVIEYLDACGEHIRTIVSARIGRTRWELGIAEMESCLCDFKGMYNGKFYSGNCADVVLATLTDSGAPQKVLDPIYEARSKLFDHRVLGEYSGWEGVDKKRKSLYQNTGAIPWRWENV
jgi:hypothetical protein